MPFIQPHLEKEDGSSVVDDILKEVLELNHPSLEEDYELSAHEEDHQTGAESVVTDIVEELLETIVSVSVKRHQSMMASLLESLTSKALTENISSFTTPAKLCDDSESSLVTNHEEEVATVKTAGYIVNELVEASVEEAIERSSNCKKFQVTQILNDIVDKIEVEEEKSICFEEDLLRKILNETIDEAIETIDYQVKKAEDLSSRDICSKFVASLVDSIPHDEHSDETSDEMKPTTSTQTCVSLILRALDNLYQ